ncbi:RNA polymerase sigma factor [Sphingobacterium deserti]|uniref:RNA polymerase, sigma-24 subunit, ECF subfamily n=1 Tax=Sphingobacterium deserti TaxID=1229276 RepID=A0A0B8T5H9_9SPHI|nr:RNA polymerase sigma factor [Sphingobacterium deserti]KGE12884.1 RNA polymerase, sigma-24 subunit, ECF subfamily [Sphingobacterium deserti]
MKSIRQYWKRETLLSLREALDDCVLEKSERGKSFIYKKYYGYVMAVVLRYVNAEMDAEEVVNESFVKVFRKSESFEKHADDEVLEKTFRSWLARIAVNTSIDMLRSKKPMEYFDDTSAEDIKMHSTVISDKLGVEDILKLLDKIPDIQRSIFNLFEIEGYSHEEIGEMLSIPESTSRTYLTRAKQRLRKLYIEEFTVSQNIHM